MIMNLTPDRQGYLGDLMNKTLPQLKELLYRQEQILSKRPFLEKLPDGGESVRKFASHLKELIQSQSSPRENLIECNQPLSDTVLSHGEKTKVMRGKSATRVQDGQLDEDNGQTLAVSQDELASKLQTLTLGVPFKAAAENTHENSYERIIKKNDTLSTVKKTKFLPNRTLIESHEKPTKTCSRTLQQSDEESAVHPPVYKYQESQIISIEESLKLIEHQQIRNQELIAERAAQRLAEQLSYKVSNDAPIVNDREYRDPGQKEAELQDSDDDLQDDDGNYDENDAFPDN